MKTFNNIAKTFFTLACLTLISNATAQNTCIATSGNWGNSSTWTNCGGGIPQDGDIVKIPDNVSVTVNASNQYSANGTAPLLYIYLGDNDLDSDGGHISFDGKLNLAQSSTFIVYDNSFTTDDAPGSSEKVRWWTSTGSPAGVLSGSATAFSGPATVTDAIITYGTNDPLPVEFAFFAAEAIDGNTLLNWSTVIEENNDYFTIERSANGIDSWEEIGTIRGAGNSSDVINYNFIDYTSMNGTSYYRVKQTDFDGQYAYSEIAASTLENTVSKVYPNPASSILNITGDAIELNDIKIFNTRGEEVNITNIDTLDPSHKKIDVSNLNSGMYFVLTTSTKHTIHVE